MQNVWELLKERDFIDKERRAIRLRIKVIKVRISIKNKSNDFSGLLHLLDALGYEEATLTSFSRRLGEIDRQLSEITDQMEQSANRQEGADNVQD